MAEEEEEEEEVRQPAARIEKLAGEKSKSHDYSISSEEEEEEASKIAASSRKKERAMAGHGQGEAEAPILKISSVLSLLSQLCDSTGAPHTAILCIAAGGAVIASQACETVSPFPPASLDNRDEDERARVFAAVASSSWEEERGLSADGEPSEPLMLESELGRIGVVGVGVFLLVLVGTEVTPWPVLDTKIRMTAEVLREGLGSVGGL